MTGIDKIAACRGLHPRYLNGRGLIYRIIFCPGAGKSLVHRKIAGKDVLHGLSSRVVIIGAGIVGLASACHILRKQPGVDLMVVERLPGPGLGDTAKSAAAFRDMFSSRVNRELSQGSIAFYENSRRRGSDIDFMKIGYLWLMTAREVEAHREVLTAMARAGVAFDTLDAQELQARLPELELRDISQGIFGRNCGILKPLKLARYYEQEVLRLGGRVRYRAAVTGFSRDRRGRITGIRLGGEEISGTVVAAAGAWNGRLMALADLEVPAAARKRQLFSVPARTTALARLLSNTAFSSHPGCLSPSCRRGPISGPKRLPLPWATPTPTRPWAWRSPPGQSRGFSRPGSAPRWNTTSRPSRGPPRPMPGPAITMNTCRTAPLSWRGLVGALVVGGTSGSGVMKADSLGRVVAGRLLGREVVELAHGKEFRVADLGLNPRVVPLEKFVI